MKKDKNVVKQFLNLGIGTFASVLLGFLTTPFITRVIDPTEMGKLSIVNSYVGILLSIAYLGLDKGLIRFFYTRKNIEDEKSLLKLCVGTSLLASIALLLAYEIAKLFGIVNSLTNLFHLSTAEFSATIYVLIALYTAISIWNTFSNNLLRLTYQTKVYSFCMVIQKIAYIIIIGLGVIFHRNDLFILLLSTIGSIAVATLMAVIFTRKYWDFRNLQLPKDKKEIYRYSFPHVTYALLITLIDSLDKFYIQRYCDDYEVGVYTSAFSLIVVFTIVQSIFNTIWSPVQTEHFVNNPEDPTFIRKGNRYITIILFALGFSVILTKDIVVFILGQQYRGASTFMPFLVVGSLMYILSETVNSGINISKKSYLLTIVSLGACNIDLLALTVLVPTIGAKGAAIARCLANTVYFYLTMYYSNKYYCVDYKPIKSLVLLVIMLVYSYENTFINNLGMNIVLYIVAIVIMIILYKNDIKEMLEYFISQFLKKEKVD